MSCSRFLGGDNDDHSGLNYRLLTAADHPPATDHLCVQQTFRFAQNPYFHCFPLDCNFLWGKKTSYMLQSPCHDLHRRLMKFTRNPGARNMCNLRSVTWEGSAYSTYKIHNIFCSSIPLASIPSNQELYAGSSPYFVWVPNSLTTSRKVENLEIQVQSSVMSRATWISSKNHSELQLELRINL